MQLAWGPSSTNLALTQAALITTSCRAVIWSVVVVVVVACCCCILYQPALMLALIFAPCILTIAPCARGVFHLLTGANIPLAQVAVVTSCNLRWVLSHAATSADSPLANMVVSPSATSASGASSSIHWRKYSTCPQETCTVWWYILAATTICDILLWLVMRQFCATKTLWSQAYNRQL